MKLYSKIFVIGSLLFATGVKAASVSNFHGSFSATPFFHFPTFSDVVKINIGLNPNGILYEYHNTNDLPYGTGLRVCWKKNSFMLPESTCHYNSAGYNINTTEIMLGDTLGLESNTNYIITVEAHSTKMSNTDFDPNEEEWHNSSDGMIGNLDRKWREVARFEIITQHIGPHTSESTNNFLASPKTP